MNQKTRKLMTMHKAVHPGDDVDRLYGSKRERKKDLLALKASIDASRERIKDYIEKCGGRLITASRNNTDDTRIKRTEITRKPKWEEKQLYGRFKRLTSDISHETKGTWLRKWNFKRETESIFTTTQSNAIRTNHIKVRIDNTQRNRRCRLCGDRDETINHVSECSKLAQEEYKTWHDWVDKMIQWELCKKLKFDHTIKWYMYNPESFLLNKTDKLIRDFEIQTDHVILVKWPDLVIINKTKNLPD